MTGRRERPPRMAGWLARHLLPRDVRDAALGDLDEEFLRLQRPRHGALRSHAWYWREAGSLVSAFARHRLAHATARRGRPQTRAERVPPRRSTRLNVVQDVRHAWRALVRTPGFTTLTLTLIALGLGTGVAVFAVVSAALLTPFPLPDAHRIVVPSSTNPSRGVSAASVSYPMYAEWTDEDVFEHVALFQPAPLNLAGAADAVRAAGAHVTREYFDVLEVSPLFGRLLGPADYEPDAPSVAVIGHGFWQRQYGGDPAVIGSDIRLDGAPATIVGVLAVDAPWPMLVDIWLPMWFGTAPPEWAWRHDNMIWGAVARLHADRTLAETQARLDVIAGRTAEAHPESMAGWRAMAIPLRDRVVGGDLRRTLLLLLAAAVFVLLVVCANVAGLLLVRTASRRHELAIRTALGAAGGRLVSLVLAESLVLALLGGALGFGVAHASLRMFVGMAPETLPGLTGAAIDWRVAAVGLAATLATALACSLAPARLVSRGAPAGALRTSGRAFRGDRSGRRLRSALVVAEVALSVVLLVAAGLTVRSFVRLQAADPGFQTDGRLTMEVMLQGAKYRDAAAQRAFVDEAVGRLRALPRVTTAAVTSALPVGGGGFYLGRVFLREGQPEPPASEDHPAQWNIVTPGYFAAMGIPLVSGRDFTARDSEGATPVIIVSRTMAERLAPDGRAIGMRIRSWRDENVLREIVGIVGDVRYFDRADDLRPLVYVPYRQDPWSSLVLVVRTQGPATLEVPDVRAAIAGIDADLALANVRTLDLTLDRSVAGPRLAVWLLTLFAVVAGLLAAAGLYGIVSQTVVQRTHEVGVRMALGARVRHVVSLVMGQGLVLLALGVLGGLSLSLVVMRAVGQLLYEVAPTDPATFATVAALFVAVGLLAFALPAWRAARVDPTRALRSE